ncbi:hypothetical protein L1887_18313 [Cichorium endivia]|nr:hypothetical protein L1887_18313 [Cichorium endivia]
MLLHQRFFFFLDIFLSMNPESSEILKTLLPCGVIYQFAPVDTPAVVNAFLEYWKPYALVLVESELWPNLVLSASANGSLFWDHKVLIGYETCFLLAQLCTSPNCLYLHEFGSQEDNFTKDEIISEYTRGRVQQVTGGAINDFFKM